MLVIQRWNGKSSFLQRTMIHIHKLRRWRIIIMIFAWFDYARTFLSFWFGLIWPNYSILFHFIWIFIHFFVTQFFGMNFAHSFHGCVRFLFYFLTHRPGVYWTISIHRILHTHGSSNIVKFVPSFKCRWVSHVKFVSL